MIFPHSVLIHIDSVKYLIPPTLCHIVGKPDRGGASNPLKSHILAWALKWGNHWFVHWDISPIGDLMSGTNFKLCEQKS